MRLSRAKKAGIAITLLLSAVLLLVGGGVLRWLRLYIPRLPAALFWTVWLLPDAAFALTSYVPRGWAKNLCRRVGEAWYTLMLYPLGFMLLFRGLGLFLPLPLRETGWCVFALSALTLSYAVPRALFPKVKEYTFSLPGLEKGMKLVLLADLHLGFFTPRGLLPRLKKLVNRQSADAVVIAGDIFDEEYAALRHPEEAAAALRGMESALGTFGCEGNHDRYAPSPEAEAFLRDAGITMLYDQWCTAGPIRLAGRLDYRRRQRMSAGELMAAAPPGRPRVVLDHNPHDWDKVLEAGADLVLCGHTHGGQTFPGNCLARLVLRCPVYGLHRHGDGLCVVTSGAGIWGLPVRLGVNGEIVVLRLLPQEEEK